jgi:hypothetical protein
MIPRWGITIAKAGIITRSGPDDPNFCVLRFRTERYNLLVDWQQAQGTL